MSGEKLVTSSGVPNGEPPTPTSSAFPSPVFETPNNHQGPFESTGGWTPRFAEEYSVFNATPGNLRGNLGSGGAFAEFDPATAATPPYSHPPSASSSSSSSKTHQSHQSRQSRQNQNQSQGRKRRRDPEDIAVEIASHVNHFSPNPNLPLPPVDPSRRLASSPGLPPFSGNETHSDPERPSKKPRIQTTTPPPTDKRTTRPRIRIDKMQNDESFNQADFSGMTNFDMFGYPMSAPATAPTFDNGRNFWDTDTMGMGTMELDFNVSADLFQTTSPNHHHRQVGSFDWGQQHTADMFQQPSGTAPPATAQAQAEAPAPPQQAPGEGGQENIPPPAPSASRNTAASAPATKTVRPLAPKPAVVTSPDTAAFPTGHYPSQSQNEDPFGAPLFSRPPSSSMDVPPFNPMAQIPVTQSMSQPVPLQVPHNQLAPRGGGLRRSVSTREMGTTKQNARPPAQSPVKSNLQRSFSESKGKKPTHRASLPTLAPAIKPITVQTVNILPSSNSGPHNNNRPKANPSRPSGRISPSKHHHRRLPSLSAIPESSPRKSRTDVKFVIDSHGRARVEPVIINGEHMDYPRHGQLRRTKPDWDSSGDDSSDTDDEPIIIPSRNTSFALPDPIEVQPSASFHASQRSLSERSAISFSSFGGGERRGSRNEGDDSDTETVMNDHRPKVSGDAASELRKVMETRQKRPTTATNGNSRQPRPMSASFGGSLMSPASMTDSSNTPTPSADRHAAVRCVCNSTAERDNEYMVQCESCEMWLHGKCLKINRHNHPRVYICAFCANTPNMRNGRMRVASGNMGPPVPIPSPLAQKSFQSFR